MTKDGTSKHRGFRVQGKKKIKYIECVPVCVHVCVCVRGDRDRDTERLRETMSVTSWVSQEAVLETEFSKQDVN